MSVKKIKENVHFVGVIDWDRKIFDNLIPLPDGTSYNAYIIKGSEKTVLIDTVDPAKKDILFENLEKLKVEKIDYIIANHAEQDHSGSIPFVLEKYPEATVVCTPKCKTFLVDFGLVTEDKVKTIEDRENISLGDKTLEFIYTPWVHWPETMVTYLKEDKILFSCDFFGSHIASSDFFVKDEAKIISDAKRYYAEIMMPFRGIVSKNIEKIEQYDIDIIAPSHGLMYDKPSMIIDAYKDWVSGKVKNEVVIPYISMHGSTAKMVDHLVLNEAELTLPIFLKDLAAGRARHIYMTKERPELKETPPPLWDLIDILEIVLLVDLPPPQTLPPGGHLRDLRLSFSKDY